MAPEKKELKCTFAECKAVFSKLYKLQIHLRKHTGERPFNCREEGCSKTYTNEAHLRRHELTFHAQQFGPSITCPYKDCIRVLSNKYALKKHINRIHEKEYPHVCEVCEKGFIKKHQLQAHKYHHTGDFPFKCDRCDKGFADIITYKKHVRNHKTYKCVCGEIFHRWSLLLKHRKQCVKRTFICETCKKEFISKGNYNNHLKIHNDNREVVTCPMDNCGRLYYDRKNLQHHIDVYHLKIKQHSPRRKPSTSKNNSMERSKRKDVGSLRKSTALELVGLTAPYAATKDLLSGKAIEISLSFSEESDVELRVKLTKAIAIESSSDIDSNIEEIAV